EGQRMARGCVAVPVCNPWLTACKYELSPRSIVFRFLSIAAKAVLAHDHAALRDGTLHAAAAKCRIIKASLARTGRSQIHVHRREMQRAFIGAVRYVANQVRHAFFTRKRELLRAKLPHR